MEPKIATLLFSCFKIFALCIQFVAVAFRSEDVFENVTPVTYFGPTRDSPLGGSGQNASTHVRGHEFFIPTMFGKDPSSGSVVNAYYVFGYIHAFVQPPPPLFT